MPSIQAEPRHQASQCSQRMDALLGSAWAWDEDDDDAGTGAAEHERDPGPSGR